MKNTINDKASRFSSVGSGQFSSVGSSSDEAEQPVGYFSSFKYYLGSALSKTAEAAYIIKDKVSEMEIASKLKVTGMKTVEVIKDTGSKVKVSLKFLYRNLQQWKPLHKKQVKGLIT